MYYYQTAYKSGKIIKNIEKLSDEELVKIITGGDIESYQHIVDRYEAPLLRYARTMLSDPDQAADAVQNAFIKSYTNLRSFKTDRKFSSWIYRITHNESINLIKKHKREFRPDDDSWFDMIEDMRIRADEQMDNTMLGKQLQLAIATLASKYRQPFVLHTHEGMSYEEVGEVLRLPTATVGTRIHRAKDKLRKELASKGVEYDN